jgi:hypothetical protein
MGLATDHFLLEHCGRQSLEDSLAPPDPQVLVTAHQLADDRIAGREAGPVVLAAELGGQVVKQPGRARTPGLRGHQGVTADTCGGVVEGDRRGTAEGARGGTAEGARRGGDGT